MRNSLQRPAAKSSGVEMIIRAALARSNLLPNLDLSSDRLSSSPPAHSMIDLSGVCGGCTLCVEWKTTPPCVCGWVGCVWWLYALCGVEDHTTLCVWVGGGVGGSDLN